MALTAFALEMVALWFQHVMALKPCVLCIYESLHTAAPSQTLAL